jgi:histone H3/H4
MSRHVCCYIQHPGESVAVAARIMGQIWSSMNNEEKQVYHRRAADERERVAAEVKAWEEQYSSLTGVNWVASDNSHQHDNSNLVYPAARIRKICKLDPDVRGLSKEALLLITKAAELFTAAIGNECVQIAQIQNRRKLLPDDLVHLCNSRERLEFLRDDIKDLAKVQLKEAQAAIESKKATQKISPKTTNHSNTIKSYFSSVSSAKSVPEMGIADG